MDTAAILKKPSSKKTTRQTASQLQRNEFSTY